MEEKFFLYIARIGKHDALYKIKEIAIGNDRYALIHNEFVSNFKLANEAASVPMYFAMLAGSETMKKIKDILLHQARSGDSDSFQILRRFLDGNMMIKGFESVIPTYQVAHETGFLATHIDVLYKLIAIRFYGCLEDFSKKCLKYIVLNDNDFLMKIHEADIKIGNRITKKLYDGIINYHNNGYETIEDAYDDTILNLGYKFTIYSRIFTLNGCEFDKNTISQLQMFESSRNIIVHKNSIMDKKYLDESRQSEYSELNQLLKLTANEMRTWQQQIVNYSSILSLNLGQ